MSKKIKKSKKETITEKNLPKFKVLVLSGGSAKGIAHIGALQVLYENDLLGSINTISGTSIGALIGFLYSIGYTPAELYDFVLLFDFGKIIDLKLDRLFNMYGL